MSMRLLCAGVVSASLLLMIPGQAPAKKPADLPVKVGGKCQNDAGVTIQVPTLGPAPICLDTGFPIGRSEAHQVFNFWLGLFQNAPATSEEAAECLTLDAFGKAKFECTLKELLEEQDAVKDLLPS